MPPRWPGRGQAERRQRLRAAVEVARSQLAYVDPAGRERFHDLMTGLGADGACRWISDEAPAVLARVTGGLLTPAGRFVLGLDGVPVAATHGHGHAIDWL